MRAEVIGSARQQHHHPEILEVKVHESQDGTSPGAYLIWERETEPTGSLEVCGGSSLTGAIMKQGEMMKGAEPDLDLPHMEVLWTDVPDRCY